MGLHNGDLRLVFKDILWQFYKSMTWMWNVGTLGEELACLEKTVSEVGEERVFWFL